MSQADSELGAVAYIQLGSGHRIAYQEFGASRGRPIFYFHGSPGSRYEASFSHEPASQQHIRVIALDRPGMGRSDPKPGRRLLDWPLDVLEVAGHLHIDRFGVVGASGGGPYVLACASEIPDRLDFAAVLGSWAPVHGTHLAWEMAPLDRFFSRLSGGLPWLFYIPFWFLGMAAQRLSPQAFLRSLGSSMSDPDRRLAKEPSVAAFYAHDVREAFQQGVRGPADDAILLYQAWGFVLDDIRIPVRIFHGREDRFAPYAFAEYLHARIPHSILHDYSGEGHLFLYRLFGDVFSAAPPVGSDT